MNTPYEKAQLGIIHLKAAVYELLKSATEDGLKNSEIGRSLGIYQGHEGHEGHISRTVPAMLEREGVVQQHEETKAWVLKAQHN